MVRNLFFWKITNQTLPFPLLCPVELWVTQDGQWWSSKGPFPFLSRQANHPICRALLSCWTWISSCWAASPLLKPLIFQSWPFPKWFHPWQKDLGKRWLKAAAWWHRRSHRAVMWLSLLVTVCSAWQTLNRCRNALWTKVQRLKAKNPTVTLFYVLPLYYKEVENSSRFPWTLLYSPISLLIHSHSVKEKDLIPNWASQTKSDENTFQFSR